MGHSSQIGAIGQNQGLGPHSRLNALVLATQRSLQTGFKSRLIAHFQVEATLPVFHNHQLALAVHRFLLTHQLFGHVNIQNFTFPKTAIAEFAHFAIAEAGPIDGGPKPIERCRKAQHKPNGARRITRG